LFDVVREMRSRGVAFIYISHRLDEIKSLADNVVILKDGRFIARHPVEDLSQDEMVTLMVGRELKELFPVPKPKPVSHEPPVIEIVNLVDPPFVKSASFTIYAGEVVGIYGLEGHGQDQVLACLAGAHRPFSGIVKLRGQARVWTGVAGAIASGFGYVPEDRKTQGLILNLSGVRNISLPILRRRLSRLGIVAGTRETRMGMQAAKASGIRGDFSRPVNRLSGGNQQKTVLARWFAARSDILLLNQPTRGVDVGAKAEIYRLVREVCSEQGAVALVVSREISELLGFCDRILVMSYGRLVGEYGRDATEEQVLATAVGGRR
jgi:ABC-type sugar transport system ATPase subunit